MGQALVFLIDSIVGLVILAVIVSAVISWLIAFDVINTRNHFVYQVTRFLDAVTAPLLSPIQRVIPSLGGVDISPIILILLLQAVRIALRAMVYPALIGLLG
jgi:YggT family protein